MALFLLQLCVILEENIDGRLNLLTAAHLVRLDV